MLRVSVGGQQLSPDVQNPVRLRAANLAFQRHITWTPTRLRTSCDVIMSGIFLRCIWLRMGLRAIFPFFSHFFPPFLGHTPSMAGTLRRKFRKNSGKTAETLLELSFPEFSPSQYGWGRLFFPEMVPERASQSRSWNSQQY